MSHRAKRGETGRYTVIVRSEEFQTLFQPYQGMRQEEAALIANLCVQAINAARGEAEVIIRTETKGLRFQHAWTCWRGHALEGDDEPVEETTPA